VTAQRFDDVAIALGEAWTSPFARWQGPFRDVSSLDLAVDVTIRALRQREIDPSDLREIVLGWTVPQETIFYGAPTVAARIGAPAITGPMISQACATSVAGIGAAASRIEAGSPDPVLVVMTDRTSNGPHVVYPNSGAMGGAPRTETWVLASFANDPWAGAPMVETAEAVAREAGFTRGQLDEAVLLRYAQYERALAQNRAFQRRFMVAVTVREGNQDTLIDADVGVLSTSADALSRLTPSRVGGVVTPGAQTHPADGTAGAILRRRALIEGPVAQLLAVGFARVERARMPRAPVPAALAALAAADISVGDVDLVTTHNPFIVSDLWLARETGLPLEKMNTYGSPLVYGHPQAPTGLRATVELIESLVERGGGVGLFTGCAAGDTGGALVLRVDDAARPAE
jgi:acetyl-CoA acetyltransferase